MDECAFCEEFDTGILKLGRVELKYRKLFETENFMVFPALGQIVEGYLLIAPKEHYVGIANIPEGLFYELEYVSNVVKNVLRKNYLYKGWKCTPLLFEHGSISRDKKAGCCLEHAHLHIVPIRIPSDNIKKELSEKLQCEEIISYNQIKIQLKRGRPYIFYESNEGERYLFDVNEDLPSQYMRRVIAKNIGQEDRWDWRKCMGLDELVKTIGYLEGKFPTK